MATGEQFPHPILKEPVLYVLDPPKRIKWMHILEAFNSCGTVTSSGKSCVDNNPNRKKWTLLFPTLFQAEMALATLQGHIITRVNPVWEMVLSHSPTLESALPLSPLFPQFVKSNGSPLSMGNDTTPQTLFKWFSCSILGRRTRKQSSRSKQRLACRYGEIPLIHATDIRSLQPVLCGIWANVHAPKLHRCILPIWIYQPDGLKESGCTRRIWLHLFHKP
ncbi:hypothetical protein BDY19DRAFT_178517 [Irpex rosettiformis]|uniref:Uncharacterized protein n=1 Tax=Irpex rosettiformis TaxID=378272 RepID=A0ACB8U305_9APHY|nr:hypothetical protein BDY19DRAFT_178517 [Irpex rosettiformis]